MRTLRIVIASRMRRAWVVVALALASLGIAAGATAYHVTGGGQSFLVLQPGFTQDIFGVSQHFMGGVAFAPDGDPWVDDCASIGSHLHRYDAQSTPPPVNGTSLHTESIHPSNAGCGLTNHSGGSLYTNTSPGVIRLSATTGAQTGGPFGPPGNALGIAEDPETTDLMYVGSTGAIQRVDAALTTSSTFSTVTTANFVDGIAFDPTGDFLFLANRSPSFRLTILNGDTGALIQHVPMTSEPDGISFHATTPKFVITNNTNGTITRFDFPADDYSMPPAQSPFAAGGFRGDLSQVGPDGCVYLTQAGTRYNNGATTGENSLVRICGGFAPTPGVVVCELTLSPDSATNTVGTPHVVTARVTCNDEPQVAVVVRFFVTGSGSTPTPAAGTCPTGPDGTCTFTYTSPTPGSDVIRADTIVRDQVLSDTATKTWTGVLPPQCPPDDDDNGDDGDDDGVDDEDEGFILGLLLDDSDSDDDGINDGNDDGNGNGEDDEDEDDDDECPDDDDEDGDGEDDEDEDDDEDDDD